jgi:hypothetical protein
VGLLFTVLDFEAVVVAVLEVLGGGDGLEALVLLGVAG